MNIVYAIKIFAALVIALGATRIIAGKGLRELLTPGDWKAVWPGVVGTLVVCCFSWRVGLFFVTFSAWALYAPRLFGKGHEGRLPAYVLLACISPQFQFELENIGPLRDIMQLNAFRILEIFILLPEAVRLAARRDRPPHPGWLRACDLATVAYVMYWTLHGYGHLNASSLAREAFSEVLDSLVPYYVLSRTCLQPELRRRVMTVALFAIVFQCVVGVVEALSRHLLYGQLQWLYGERWNLIGALTRGDWVRAQAATPGPLILGVLALFGIGVWWALRPAIRTRSYLLLGAILVAGMLATFSRGPALALLILCTAGVALRFMSARGVLVASLALTALTAVCWNLGLGDAVVGVINQVSGLDKTADFNVLYRQELLKTSVALIQQSPWFGVPDYMSQMQSLRQGEGIIDLVNTYLVVLLNVGAFGLLLYLAPFAIVLWKQGAKPLQESDALHRETTAWVPLTMAILAVVFTVSPISIVHPILIWVVTLAIGRLQEASPQQPHRRGVAGADAWQVVPSAHPPL